MSSHLTINYTGAAAAGSKPAAATAVDAPAADGPLGFLAALVDQLLAGGAQGASASAPTAEALTTAIADIGASALSTLNLQNTTPSDDEAKPIGADLLATLGEQLDALKHQLESGEATDPALVQQITDTVQALSALLTPTAAAPASAISDQLDPLAALAAPKLETGKTEAPSAQPLSDSDIAQLLASIGVTAQSAAPAEKIQGTPPDLPEVTAKLTSLATSLAATSPDLAETLKTLADKLDAAAPAQLAAIGVAPADPDAVSIAKIVRLLLGAQATTDAGQANPSHADTVAEASGTTAASAPPGTNLPPQLTQLLASLGVTLPTTSGASTDHSATAPTSVADITPATLSTVGQQLDAMSKAVADKAPDLAQKLETVAAALSAASSDPKLAAQIGAAAQQGGASLEKLVQQLVDPRPTVQIANAAAPQVAALAGVQIAKDVSVGTPKAEPKSAAIAPVSPEPVAQTTTPSIKLTAAAAPVIDGILPADGKLKDDAAVLTAAITSDKSPAPASDPAAQNTVAQPLTSPLGTAARALPAAYQPVANPINMGQVAIEMMRQVQHGSSRFTIRLDPPELGRVDVKMHVDAAGTVNARLTVERAETLDLFQRDKGSLERALSQAGVEGGKANLEFSLKQNPFAGMTGGDQRPSHGQQGGYQTAQTPDDDDLSALPAITLYRGTASAGGVNIFA